MFKLSFLLLLGTFQVYAQVSPEASIKTPITPQEAIKDINSGKLTFIGREKFPGSFQNYTCVYKSERAYVIYNNCMGSKKENPTMDMEIISFGGTITSFYNENKTTDVPVSERNRSQYDMSWRVGYTPSPAVGRMTIPEIIAFKEKYDYTTGGCFIGSTFKAQDMNSEVACLSGEVEPEWNAAAASFWKEPSDEWYETKKYLRTVIKSSKF